MKIIFCADVLTPSQPDSDFATEYAAAQAAGFECEIFDFEKLTGQQNAQSALRRVREMPETTLGIYRGWMLRPSDYALLFSGLAQRNIALLNSPPQYQHCHYLPDSYDVIAPHTARSVWLEAPACFDMELVMKALTVFGDSPLILKDYVKSRKHEWLTACYISSAARREAVEPVVKMFLELQGENLNVGLVFRQWQELKSIGAHPKSQMPLAREFRQWFLDGELLGTARYWEQGETDEQIVPDVMFEDVARRVQSRFFTLDVAQKTDGSWMIVELGDGQVAGLPESVDVEQWYRALFERLGVE